MMKMTKKQSRKNRRGFVLALALAMVVLLSVVGLGKLRLGSGARMQAARTTAEISARAAADAGLTKALFEMSKDLDVEPSNSNNWWFDDWEFGRKSGNIISSANTALPSPNADYNYAIEEIVKNSKYKLTSTGRSGLAEKTVSLTIKREGLFEYPIFATGYAHPKHPKAHKRLPGRPKPLKKGGKLHIKGYDVESYSSDSETTYSGNLQIRTNSLHHHSVRIEKDIVINGDVVVGPGGKPKDDLKKVIKIHKDAEITGDTYSAEEVSEPPPVIVPENLENQEAEKYEYEPDKPISGTVKYKELKIPKGGVQEIVGDVTIYVEGDMKLEDAEFIITEGSSLMLYLDKKLEVKKGKAEEPGGIINETEDPTKLMIYGLDTCRKVKLEHNLDFYGAVYAPHAKVEIKKSGDVYGALVGWDIKLEKDKHDENHTFYFDEALSCTDETGRFVKAIWHEE